MFSRSVAFSLSAVFASLILLVPASLSMPVAPANAMPLEPGGAPSGPEPSSPFGPALVDTPMHPLDAVDVGPQPWSPVTYEPRIMDSERLRRWIDTVAHETAQDPDPEDPYVVIDACIDEEMKEQHTPGASIAIAVDGVITYTKGYGVKHRDEGGEIDAETLFRIGSTTKMMTAAALMTLVDKGLIDVHAPITDYLPDLTLPAPWNASAITPHHLLSQSSGIPDAYLLNDTQSMNQTTLEQWATGLLPVLPMNAPPGSFFNYSNPNFSLAGYLVEVVSGEPYADYVERAVWEPAGMPLTSIKVEDVMANGNYAYGHLGPAVFPPEAMPLLAIAPAGTAFSTPTEMVTWALTLMDDGGEALTPESAATMQTAHVNQGYHEWGNYGYGIFVTEWRDSEDESLHVPVFYHPGNVQGWGSELYWVPERGLAVSILGNTMDSFNVSAACVLHELGDLTPRSTDAMTTDPETWDQYEGTYAMMNQVLWDWTAQITRDESDPNYLLLTQIDLGGTAVLLNVINETFMMDQDRDGEPDEATAILDYTFIHDPQEPTRIPWLRNRIRVGHRLGQFPSVITATGRACTSLEFAADRDVADLTVSASGLTAPGWQEMDGLPISKDDPVDPTTSSFRTDFEVQGQIGVFFSVANPQQGDYLQQYLLRDADGDGEFSFPDEVVGVGLASGDGSNLLMMSGRPPAGDYQLWVHGVSVQGDDHTFSLEYLVAYGDNLSIRNAPESLTAGESYELQVCTRDVLKLREPQWGVVEFDYGYAPRRVRIPLLFLPGELHQVYLPLSEAGAPAQ